MTLEIKISDCVLSLSFVDPGRLNAISVEDASAFCQLTRDLAAEMGPDFRSQKSPRIRMICLTATYLDRERKTALSGGNLHELADLDKDSLFTFFEHMAYACFQLLHLPVPIIAASNGDLIGGGSELFLASDLRFLEIDSKIDFRQIRVGLCTGFGGSEFLSHLIGKAAAKQVMFREKKLSAVDAKKMGRVTDLFGDEIGFDDLLNKERERILDRHHGSYAVQKEMLGIFSKPTPDLLRTQARNQARKILELWGNPTHQNFLSEFRNSRKI